MISSKHTLSMIYRGRKKSLFILFLGMNSILLYRSWIVYVYNMHQTQMKRTNASHEWYEKCTIHETNARYTKRTHETNARYMNKRTKRTNDTRNQRTIHERLYYPMTNDPGSIEVQYSIVLLFEWLLCKLMWLTNLIFYTQLIYINDKLVGKVIV